MNERPKKELIEEVALLKSIDPSFIEKDWFVIQIVATFAALRLDGFEMVFTGGTSLSKAHNLLQRFSEDIDFRVIASQVHQSRSALSKFKHTVIEKLQKSGFSIDEGQVRARDNNSFFSIDLYYESYFARPHTLRPHIQIEIKVRDCQHPPIKLSVGSFISIASKRPPEVRQIACVDPVESAADKLSALAWRIPDRVRSTKGDDPTVVRHIHDVALLKDTALKDKNFSALVIASMQEDDRRSKNNPSFSGSPVAEKFQQMLSKLDEDKEYTKEYKQFVQAMSYAAEGKVPTFEDAVHAVRLLVKAVTKS